MNPDTRQDFYLAIDAFIRLAAVDPDRKFSLLLGAGASISSGMPSAQRCIWEWKREIFITRNPTLKESVGEISLPGTQKRIQRWLDQTQEFPAVGAPNEYSTYAQYCFPTQQGRRSFFQTFVKRAVPHVGYQLIAILARSKRLGTVWTTNFDGLAARACAAANVPISEVGIDTLHRFVTTASDDVCRVVSMHGDYRYDDLKNTSEELQKQEAEICEELVRELPNRDLIVLGYSGRDLSVMSALSDCYSKPGVGQLYWCGFSADIDPAVEQLIRTARSAGHEAFYVPSDGFDDVLTRFSLRAFEGVAETEVRAVLAKNTSANIVPSSFTVKGSPATALIKSNAHALRFPGTSLKCTVGFPPGVSRRDWLNEHIKPNEGAAVVLDDGILALADSAQISTCLGSFLAGKAVPFSLTQEEVSKDGRLQALVRKGLLRALASHLQLESDGDRRAWDVSPYEHRSLNGTRYAIHRAFALRVLDLNGQVHVTAMPEVVPKNTNAVLAGEDETKILRNQIYGYQHNDVFDKDLKFWFHRICGFDIPSHAGESFHISKSAVCAGISQPGRTPLPSETGKFMGQFGIIASDANLIFSSSDGKHEVGDPNPLRGLVNNRPWDYEVTRSGLSRAIDLAIICPSVHAKSFHQFLCSLHQSAQPAPTEKDYLQSFPGFAAAFGLPLQIPAQNDPLWIAVDPDVKANGLSGAKELAGRLCNAIDSVRASRPGAVCLIYIPKSWADYEKFEVPGESFDLHDLVKAYSARRGQSTQFIREKTLHVTQAARVRWWLSLALYAKGMRTPWRIESLDDDTAFVGIGYSVDYSSPKAGHILLGCSHLYSARGEGLQFRLGRIENPIYRNRNPYMSLDDARRTGETIRQLFFDAKLKLPSRVVIHKRTPYRQEEQDGLSAGLEGVQNIELLEVTFEDSLRYLASTFKDGKLSIDRFPVQRGTTVIQNRDTALLWVHGSAPSAANPSYRYFQGKRRIPTPLMIRRYKGNSDISQIAAELLGLSKMNWNHFEYYSQLPATLLSASAIARVGPYLSGFGSAPYDYRLLI